MLKHLWLPPLIAIGILCSLNLLMVGSLAPAYLGKQIIILFTGIVFYFFGRHLNPEQPPRNYWLVFVFSCLILLLPALRPPSTRRTKKWLDLCITSIPPS